MLAGYRGLQLQPKQYLQPRLEQMNLWAFSRNGPCSYCKGLIILFPPSAQVTLIHKEHTFLFTFLNSTRHHKEIFLFLVQVGKTVRAHFTGSPPLCLFIDCSLTSFSNPSLKLPLWLFCLPGASFGSMRNLA